MNQDDKLTPARIMGGILALAAFVAVFYVAAWSGF